MRIFASLFISSDNVPLLTKGHLKGSPLTFTILREKSHRSVLSMTYMITSFNVKLCE